MLNRIKEHTSDGWVDCSLHHIVSLMKEDNVSLSVRVWIPNEDDDDGVWKSVVSIWSPQGRGSYIARYIDSVFMGDTNSKPADKHYKYQVLYKPNKRRIYG